MSNIVSFEQFIQARFDKSTAEVVDQVQRLLDTFVSSPAFVELAEEQTFFELLANVADHEGIITPAWLNVLTFDSVNAETNPEIAPFAMTMSFGSRLGRWLGKAETVNPIIDIKCYMDGTMDLSFNPDVTSEQVRQLEAIRADYLKLAGELVWGPGVMFFRAWRYLIDHCQLLIVEHVDDRLTVRARDVNKFDVIEVTFHLDAIHRDHAVLNKYAEETS